MPSSSLIKMSESEDAFLADLLRDRKQDPSIIIPDDMEPRAVLAAVGRCASVLVKLEKATGWIAPVLGRLMARVAKDRLWEGAGYESLKGFEEDQLLGKGISRATLWNARSTYDVYPELPLEQYVAIGPKKLAIAASVCKKLDASPKQKKELLALATETISVEEFREKAEGKLGGDSAGELTSAMFELFGTAAEVKRLKEWLADPRFLEFAKPETRPIGMILSAIEEASSVFPKSEDGNEGW